MNQTIVNIIQVTYTTCLPLVLAYIVNKVKKISEDKDKGKQADILILRLILMDMHDKYVERGYLTTHSYSTFNEIWELYTDKFHGNHLTEKFKQEVDALPIRNETWEGENA